MNYTVLYGHNEKVYKKVGDIVNAKDILAKEGSTGMSTGKHIHIAVAEGIHTKLADMRLSMLNSGKTKPDKQQCEYFAMDDLCVGGIRITTPYLDPSYETHFKIKHPAIDVVVKSPDFNYVWNRSFTGKVVATGTNDKGYGNWIMITYSTIKEPIKPTYEELEKEIEELHKEITLLKGKNALLEVRINDAIKILGGN